MVMLQAIQRTVRTKNERESPLSQVPMVVFSSLVHFIYGLYHVAHNNLTYSCNHEPYNFTIHPFVHRDRSARFFISLFMNPSSVARAYSSFTQSVEFAVSRAFPIS